MARLPPPPLSALALAASRLAAQHCDLPVRRRGFRPSWARTSDGAAPGSSAPPPSRGQAFVRLDFLLGQDLANRPLGQLAQAGMPGRRCVLAGMHGEQPGGPQFMGITQFLGLLARQRHQPGLRLCGDDRVASRTRSIIERRDHPPVPPPAQGSVSLSAASPQSCAP